MAKLSFFATIVFLTIPACYAKNVSETLTTLSTSNRKDIR
jgi:hypothetical protein